MCIQFACRILSRYYHCQRQADLRNAARTTIRLLESLIRLAQAHARLMCREFVTVQDAITAVTCVECSMQNSALLGSMNALHTKFPEDPQEEYSRQAKLVLKRLQLDDMVAAIDEAQTTGAGNDSYVSGSDVENNNQDAHVDTRANDKDKKNSSSSDEENHKLTNDSNVSKDFTELYSPDQLTGVFPIASSNVGTDTLTESVLDKVSVCEKSVRSEETNNINNSNGRTSLRNPSALRTVLNSNESVNFASSANGSRISSFSLEKSKNIIQMFSKKPVIEATTTVTRNSSGAPQKENCNIFTTEELDDADLEVEWPSDVLSSCAKEGNGNSRNVLRVTNKTYK